MKAFLITMMSLNAIGMVASFIEAGKNESVGSFLAGLLCLGLIIWATVLLTII